jgi:hypothetical protein
LRIVVRMRLALTCIALLATSLLALALVLVPAASAAGAVEEPGGEINIDMHVAGFHVGVFASESKGKQYAILYVTRRHQFAQYVAPARITASTFKARFGSFGELDYSFAPQGSAEVECFGVTSTKAEFSGTFNFSGQRGYIDITAPRVAGTYSVHPSPGCELPTLPGPKPPSPRVAPFQPYIGEGATLTASTLATKANRRVRSVSVSRGNTARTAEITAVLAEAEPGVSVVRGVQGTVPGRAFEWDFAAGTATVSAAPPFAGTATFTRLADGRKRFTGTLRAQVLGGETIHLAGAGFHATLHRGTPHED